MDEQRILDEMERMLAADDPRLAARLAAFGQPGLGQVLRTRRARATISLMALILIAAVASVIYLMSAFRLSVATGSRSGQQASTHTSQQAKHQFPTTVVPPADPARCAATDPPDCGGWSFFSATPPAIRASTPATSTASTPATSTASIPAGNPASAPASR